MLFDSARVCIQSSDRCTISKVLSRTIKKKDIEEDEL